MKAENEALKARWRILNSKLNLQIDQKFSSSRLTKKLQATENQVSELESKIHTQNFEDFDLQLTKNVDAQMDLQSKIDELERRILSRRVLNKLQGPEKNFKNIFNQGWHRVRPGRKFPGQFLQNKNTAFTPG